MKRNLIIILFVCSFIKLSNGQCLLESPENLRLYPGKEYVAKPDVTLPIVVDYSSGFQFPPLDQTPHGPTCVACAIAHLKTYQEGKKRGWDVNSPEHQFCPTFIYNGAHLEGDPPGLNPLMAMGFVYKYGCATLDMMLFTPLNDIVKSSLPAQYSATSYRNVGYGRLYFSSLEQIKQKLFLDGPILCSMHGDASHEVCITGYNDTIHNDTLIGALEYINSYGAGWHIKPNDTNPKHKYLYSAGGGYGWIPYSQVFSSQHIGYGFQYLEEETKDEPVFVLRFVGNLDWFTNDQFTSFLNCHFIKNQDTVKALDFTGMDRDKFYLYAGNFGYGTYPDYGKSLSFIIDSLDEFPDSLIMRAQYMLNVILPYPDSVEVRLSRFHLDSCLFYDKINSRFENLSFEADTLNSFVQIPNPFVTPPNKEYYFTSRLLAKIKLPRNNLSVPPNTENSSQDLSRLSVYPNPCRLDATIDLSLVKSKSVNIELHDLAGREIKEIFSGLRPVQIKFNTLDLPAGTYFIRLIGENEQKSSVLIVR